MICVGRLGHFGDEADFAAGYESWPDFSMRGKTATTATSEFRVGPVGRNGPWEERLKNSKYLTSFAKFIGLMGGQPTKVRASVYCGHGGWHYDRTSLRTPVKVSSPA